MLNKLRELGSMYYDCVANKDSDGAKLIKQKIEIAMIDLTIAEQKDITDKMEFASVAVNGQDPRESTGYGVVRDVFCTNLLGECVNISATRLNRLQCSTGESFDASEYDDRVKSCMMALSNNQFNAFKSIASTIEPSDELEDSARNRQIYAIDHVRGLLKDVDKTREENIKEA